MNARSVRFVISVSLFVIAPEAATAASPWEDHPENVWVRQSPRENTPAPGFYYEGSGAFDPFSNKWIHHAGHDGIPQGFHTFTCDLATGVWAQCFPPTSPPGVCCVDGANVFDVAHRRFVRFPGGSLGHGYQWSRGVYLKDSAIWLYDPVSGIWTNMRPPPYREPEKYSKDVIGGLCSGGTYAGTHELAISFGGTGAGGAKNSLYFYDAYANALHQIQASNTPPARDGMGIAYDPVHDQLVMFGSQYLSDERTWFYDFRSNVWQARELTPHPPGEKFGTYSTIPKMAYDSVNNAMMCLVWLDNQGHETWALDADKLIWTKLGPAVEPPPSKSRSRNLSFSPEHNLFILELSTTNNRPELWTYRYKKARSSSRPAPPTNLEVVTESNKAKLRWAASIAADVKEYRVYRAQSEQPWRVTFTNIGNVSNTMFEDTNLTSGKTYFYTIGAVARDESESQSSFRARTQPRVLGTPVVSVLATNRIEIRWNAHSASDVVGYNVYRGLASVKTVKNGEPGAWKDNDPEYAQSMVVKITDIKQLKKLNDEPLRSTTHDDHVDLTRRTPEAADYKFSVYAYIVRAVNKLGVESGASPYALTIPSEPLNVVCRERGDTAELKWDGNPEKAIAGYRVYKLKGTWEIFQATTDLVRNTTFSQQCGREPTRYWVVAVDALGQEGQPSSPAWCNHSYRGFFSAEWHQ